MWSLLASVSSMHTDAEVAYSPSYSRNTAACMPHIRLAMVLFAGQLCTNPAAAGTVEDGGSCTGPADCKEPNSYCISLRNGTTADVADPLLLCTTKFPDRYNCDGKDDSCYSGKCFPSTLSYCLLSVGEVCHRGPHCASGACSVIPHQEFGFCLPNA